MINEMLLLVKDATQIATAGVLGLLAGALLAEGALLVPYWRTLSPKAFYELHPAYAPRLFRFFAPLTVAGPSLALLSFALTTYLGTQVWRASAATATLSMLLVGIYFVYFKGANAAFANAAIPEDGLASELGRWAAWHAFRTIVGLVAFSTSLLVLHTG